MERFKMMKRLKTKDAEEVPPPTQQRLLRRRDVAERLCLSLRSVDKLHADGVLEKVRLPARIRAAGFREADVNFLLSAGCPGENA
jgi:predicted DNA-binding transcriptional regulator AlpA